MTPKEKAKELYNRYEGIVWDTFVISDKKIDLPTLEHNIKICALIAVDEIIRQLDLMRVTRYVRNEYDYWQEVRNEIEKL